ncbi:2-C-methyl-D-erythritol 4-phosphate cytidylyltransferase [Candidatus Desantisbacteria bacterium]|nr:2-C-methyl-D-erythritol 4-phosphate cytidylyltransferase [Candidatus Desantisbacteria bacterium]
MKTTAIIAAAGQSRRMGKNLNKQFVLIAGRPLLAHTIDVFQKAPEINNIIIVVESRYINICKNEIVNKYNFTKVSSILEGGKERQDSINNALTVVNKDTDYIIIHDGARPMVTHAMICDILKQAKLSGAAITAVPVKDTIKEIDNSQVIRTLKRENLISVQTPQAFSYDIIQKAYQNAYSEGFYGTDDAMLVERLNMKVIIILGSYSNIKITTQFMFKLNENQIIEAEISNITYKGKGVSRINNMVVFFDKGVPGDKVKAKIVKVKKNYAEAVIVELLEPSSSRINPQCSHFQLCGGCQFQDIGYKQQLEYKTLMVRDSLLHIGKIDSSVNPIIPSLKQFYYRNQIQLKVEIGEKPILGFYENNSHQIVKINNCLLQTKIGNEILNGLNDFFAKNFYKNSEGKLETTLSANPNFQGTLARCHYYF